MTDRKWTAKERLIVLREAEECGNVAAACKRHGISRKTFYKWKRRYEETGLEGLHDRPRAPHRPVPRRRSSEKVRQVQMHALEHPGQTLKEMAHALGMTRSTVHAILKDIGLSAPSQRWGWLEQLARDHRRKWLPNVDQLRFLAGRNPAWHDHVLHVAMPGLSSPWQMGICQYRRPWFVCIHTHTGYLLRLNPRPRDARETATTWRGILQGIRSELRHWPDLSFLVRENALRQCITDLGLVCFFKPPSECVASQAGFGMLQMFERRFPELMAEGVENIRETWNESRINAYPFHGRSPWETWQECVLKKRRGFPS